MAKTDTQVSSDNCTIILALTQYTIGFERNQVNKYISLGKSIFPLLQGPLYYKERWLTCMIMAYHFHEYC